jgi:hypothetical protein
MSKKITKEIFIFRATKIHDNKYNYDEVIYEALDKKIKIFCNNCKYFFYITPTNHFTGSGCKKCAIECQKTKVRSTTEKFIKRAIEVHGDKYDYSLVKYFDKLTKIKIICKKCNQIFKQSPNHHIHQNHGCPVCGSNVSNKDKFIKESIDVHQNKYDYSEAVYKNSNTKVKLKCNICTKIFYIRPDHHLRRKIGCRCQSKIKNSSKKEIQWLDNLNVPIRQFKIKIDENIISLMVIIQLQIQFMNFMVIFGMGI